MTDRHPQAAARLAAAGFLAPESEAEALAAAFVDDGLLEAAVRRREAGEPLAWIIGTTTFGGRALVVDPGVYVPRPQSEELALRAAALLPRGGRAVDLCTGAGAVAAHLRAADPSARVIGVDLDPVAARCARRNGVPTAVGDLDGPVRTSPDTDLVTAVPPYVPTDALRLLPADVQRHEPRPALDGGEDGLTVARRVVAAAARVLRPGGALLLELGGDQDEVLTPDLGAAGFIDLTPWHDDEGDLRGLAATRA